MSAQANSVQAAPSDVQTAQLRQFVEQADARLARLIDAEEAEAKPGRAAEIERLQRLRGLAQRLLDDPTATA